MITLAPVSLEGVVQGLAAAGLLWDVPLLLAFAPPSVAEVVRIGEEAQESDQAVQLTNTILQQRLVR